jgi:hypothetical protein
MIGLLLSPEHLAARRESIRHGGALAPLADSLLAELRDTLADPPTVPTGKARMTRGGGRCPTCRVLLTFDPRSAQAHACPECHTVYTDQPHHDWWLMNAHLWTAEQAVRAATLATVREDAAAGARADAILAHYAERYTSLPNRDNVLGPTRVFFSTYLESIWLLQLAVAIDLRQAGPHGLDVDAILDRLIRPSQSLLASYPEGRSNRQAWNLAAQLAAARLLRDEAVVAESVHGPDGLIALLRDGLHDDGSWYEGENYHLFAHRGLWTAVTLAERAGQAIPAELLARFHRGFEAPFRTMLPDGTYPARRDSQYGIALWQWRVADWLEVGIARHDSPTVRDALRRCYDPARPIGNTERWRSTADAERHAPPVRLTRADLGWRALLCAGDTLPELTAGRLASARLDGQGLAVFRRAGGRWWVGLDYGDPGEGHGHPDRLNLVVATDTARWLDDMGTGSYTTPDLAWYRSTLAHNAPLVNGRSQPAMQGRLVAYDERDGAGWVTAHVVDDTAGVHLMRTVVVMSDHVLDVLRWVAINDDVTVDLPLQADPLLPIDASWSALDVEHIEQHEWLRAPHARPLVGGIVQGITCRAIRAPHRATGTPTFDLYVSSEDDAMLWRAGTPGPPAGAPHGLVALRQQGRRGYSVRVLAPHGSLRDVALHDGAIVVSALDGTVHRHTAVPTGWHCEFSAGGARSSLDLVTGPVPAVAAAPDPVPSAPIERTVVQRSRATALRYRRGDVSWEDAGRPAATVLVAAAPSRLSIMVEVDLQRAPNFSPARDENPLDNEPADINSDGVQLHLQHPELGEWCTVLAVPEPADTRVRITQTLGPTLDLTATLTMRANGYTVSFVMPPVTVPQLDLAVCVNEMPSGAERRRGQLVLTSGDPGWVYLCGDRQPRDRAVTLTLANEARHA